MCSEQLQRLVFSPRDCRDYIDNNPTLSFASLTNLTQAQLELLAAPTYIYNRVSEIVALHNTTPLTDYNLHLSAPQLNARLPLSDHILDLISDRQVPATTHPLYAQVMANGHHRAQVSELRQRIQDIVTNSDTLTDIPTEEEIDRYTMEEFEARLESSDITVERVKHTLSLVKNNNGVHGTAIPFHQITMAHILSQNTHHYIQKILCQKKLFLRHLMHLLTMIQ